MQGAFGAGVGAGLVFFARMICIILLAGIGFAFSLYAYIVEKKLKNDPTYKPACDISDRISCSKVATSPYANLFFVSNAVAGMLFYALVILLAVLILHGVLPDERLLMIVLVCGVLMSVYLAYILYTKIKSLCLVCTATYIINAALLACVYLA